MGKTKKPSSEKKTTKIEKKIVPKKYSKSYDLSPKKRIWPSFFKDGKYIHFKDLYNQKTFSLNLNEAKMFLRQLPRLEKKLNKLELQHIASNKESEDSAVSDKTSSESDDSS